jgi:hypothetical protein
MRFFFILFGKKLLNFILFGLSLLPYLGIDNDNHSQLEAPNNWQLPFFPGPTISA